MSLTVDAADPTFDRVRQVITGVLAEVGISDGWVLLANFTDKDGRSARISTSAPGQSLRLSLEMAQELMLDAVDCWYEACVGEENG